MIPSKSATTAHDISKTGNPHMHRYTQQVELGEGVRVRFHDPEIHVRKVKQRTLLGKVQGLGELTILSGVLFAALLVFFNFPSYYAQVNFWWSSMQGEAQKKELALHALTEDTVFVPLTEREVATVQEHDVPPLIGAVAPPDNRIVIPKIGKNIPIVQVPKDNLIAQNWEALEEDIQKGLEEGVVHYPGTANPDEEGNVFITGHSSYYLWAPGEYKDVFALLPNLEVGDKLILYYDQQQYEYIIGEKKTVAPTEVDVLKQTPGHHLTLMTCVPVGTNLNRLILVAEQQ